MLRRSARVLRTLEEACVRARAAPSTAIPNLPACASSSPSPSHRGAPLNGTFEPAAVDASFASGPLMFHARHHRGESLLGGDFNAETITVTFVDKDGEEEVVEAQVGKNLLEIAHMNDIELEGACEGEFCSPQVSLSLSLSLPPSLCRDETTTRALQRHRHRGLTHPPPLSPSARARACVCVCVCVHPGSLACSTCHVIVEEEDQFDLLEELMEPTDDENDMLDLAFGLTETSRLGCQVVCCHEIDGLRVRIPSATRNMAVDGFVPKPH